MKENAIIILTLFSRRFMMRNATIIVIFFESTRSDQNISLKFYEISWFQIESFGLSNSTKKVFPLFPRNKQYRKRIKGPTFSVFGIVRPFFQICFRQSVTVLPSILLMLCDSIDVEKNTKGPPF